jgi:DNA-binding protein YbaB
MLLSEADKEWMTDAMNKAVKDGITKAQKTSGKRIERLKAAVGLAARNARIAVVSVAR